MARLIDTSVIIEMERRGHSAGFINELAAGQRLAVSSITAAELLLGAERADTRQRQQQRTEFVESVLAYVPNVPFGLQAARVHARISAQLMAGGQSIGQHDLMIAATALARGYGVLTHNVRHFNRVPGHIDQRPDW